jgi:Fur family ferric uptake transcriptional regulator
MYAECEPASAEGNEHASRTENAEEMGRILSTKGLRVTAQRLLVLRILGECAGPLDAKTIHARGRAHDTRLSLSTVYRTLGTLKEKGLVESCCLTRGNRRRHYQIAGKKAQYHFACLACGRIIELGIPHVAQACREAAKELGLTLTRANVCLEGYCPACTASRNGRKGASGAAAHPAS